MADLEDGEVFGLQGSAARPYELENTGGVYSCSCPALGAAGQTKTRTFGSDATAAQEAAKLVSEKTGKGYREKSQKSP
jgi:predicted DNA-binding WGR domain protein